MEQIYKSKHFGHIDLSKIITISDACLSNGGQYVEFNIRVLSRDEPLKYERRLDDTEMKWQPGMPRINEGHNVIKTTKDEWKRYGKINIDHDTTMAEVNLQEEIDEFVSAWKSYCTAFEVANYPRAEGPRYHPYPNT